MSTIIKAGLLIDGTESEPVRDPVIVVENGRIASITSGDAPNSQGEAELIDAEGQTVLPGLIDAHLHLAWGQANQPGWAAVAGDESRILLWAARMAQNSLARGFTTVRDCGGPGNVTFRLRGAIEAGLTQGPRLRIAGPPLTTTAGHCHFFGLEADNADELRRAVRRLVRQGVDFIKIMASGGTFTPASNRRRAQYSLAELRAAVEDAHRLDKRVVVHGNATEGIRSAVEAGVDSVAHCNWLGVDKGTIEYDESVVETMAERGIFVDLNIGAVFRPLADRDGSAQDWGVKTRWEIIRKMQKKGVEAYLTSDSIGLPDGQFVDFLARMVREGKADASEVIAMVTRIPARAMGIDDEIGTVEPGKVADLVLYDANPLQDMHSLSEPATVIRSGVICVSRGKLTLPELS